MSSTGTNSGTTSSSSSSSSSRSFARSIFGRAPKREHVQPPLTEYEIAAKDIEVEAFKKHVAHQFQDLVGVNYGELLSIRWTMKLLDAFMGCHEIFRGILIRNKSLLLKPPLKQFVDAYFEKSMKALDICNATRDGIEKLRSWNNHLEIVLSALGSHQREIGEAHFRRARKALMDLAIAMLDEKDCGSVASRKIRSLARHSTGIGMRNAGKDRHYHSPKHSRSLSWSVSVSWSASKQLQSMANNLLQPRADEIEVTNGLASLVFVMSSVLVLVAWTLVAAIPCQDRGLGMFYSIPPIFAWGIPLNALHNRILEESKKSDHVNSNGLLKEIYQIENSSRHMIDLLDMTHFPLTDEKKTEVQQEVQQLAVVWKTFKNELDPLERQVRETFRKMVSFRTEGLEVLTTVPSNSG